MNSKTTHQQTSRQSGNGSTNQDLKLFRFDEAVMFSITRYVYADSLDVARWKLAHLPETVEGQRSLIPDSFSKRDVSEVAAGGEQEKELRASTLTVNGPVPLMLEGSRHD